MPLKMLELLSQISSLERQLTCHKFPDKESLPNRKGTVQWPRPVVRDIDSLLVAYSYPEFILLSSASLAVCDRLEKPLTPNLHFHKESTSINSRAAPLIKLNNVFGCSFKFLSSLYVD